MSHNVLALCFGLCVVVVAHGARIPLPGPVDKPDHVRYFYFTSPSDRVEIKGNDTISLESSGIKAATKTYVILDGFTSNVDSYMTTQTKNAFATLSDVNVVVADWSYYNGARFIPEKLENIEDVIVPYAVALAHLPIAGSNIAKFLAFLREHKQIEFSDIVVLSHSLGCLAAGATGKAVKLLFNTKIGRIVGLDPAVQFVEIENAVRLQPGDASVVEIYHTGREMIGDVNPAVGDVMIYPNGGESQPCEEEGAPGTTACNSHSYSWKLYNYGLQNTTMKACPCRGAACLCTECEIQCEDDEAIVIGPSIPENAKGSYHLRTGFLQWD